MPRKIQISSNVQYITKHKNSLAKIRKIVIMMIIAMTYTTNEPDWETNVQKG